jgi:predicted DsbA family dithiol-disulfide isomerase
VRSDHRPRSASLQACHTKLPKGAYVAAPSSVNRTPVEIFYDFNCPYCRLSKRLLYRFVARLASPVVWRPFELLPDVPKAGAPWLLLPSEMRAFRKAVEDRAAQIGLPVTVPPFRPNTYDALRLAEYAKSLGRFDPLQEAIFDAYWTFGDDIGSHEILLNLAVQNGMDSERSRTILESDAYGPDVHQYSLELRALEYAAIPAFRAGDVSVFGLESEAAVVRFLEAYALESAN